MTSDSHTAEKPSPLATTLAAVWAIGFLLRFFWQDLPNTAVSRLEIWQSVLETWPTTLNPFDYSTGSEHRAGWRYLSERMPFLATAGLLSGASWGLGHLVCGSVLRQLQLLRSERIVIILGVGLSLQTLWILLCGLFHWLTPVSILCPGVIALFVVAASLLRRTPSSGKVEICAVPDTEISGSGLRWFFVAICIPFILHIALGSFTPPWDFDVREYHLQGPKEWFLAGHIFNLEHNVYTSFPFLSEMLSLGAMVLQHDWWRGAIAGKVTLAAFQFLAAIGIFAVGRRWFGLIPACIAAAAFLSTPWIVRISTIAYAEGAITFYLIASVMVALLAVRTKQPRIRLKLIAITGFLAGSAMASKYPGVVSVILPVGLFLLARVLTERSTKNPADESPPTGRLRVACTQATVFIAAVVIAVGPWLLKNYVSTGNPVYPLAYSVFGASDWSPEMDAKWKRGHSASEHHILRIPQHLSDVAIRNDWQNGFLFAFAVPAILLVRRKMTVGWLLIHAGWLLGTWWLFTHRIDRFWIPLLPVVAVLAGSAWTISPSLAWRGFTIATLSICAVFNFGLSRHQGIIGRHVGLMEMKTARELPIRQDLLVLNAVLKKDARLLMVGEAEVFDAEFDLIYNTVFDESIFQQWTSSEPGYDTPAAEQKMRSAAEVRDVLHKNGITHIYVNWSEILRYRLTYGYTEYVFPDRFRELQQSGVLEKPVLLSVGDWNRLNEAQRKAVESWKGGRTLRLGPDSWSNIQLYPVSSELQ